MGVMLQRDNQSQKLYLHDVVIEEEATSPSKADLSTTGAVEDENHLYMTTILQRALDVKNEYMQNSRNDAETDGEVWNSINPEDVVADRKSQEGELVNEYYSALDKREWTQYYDYIARKGFLSRPLGTKVTMIIGDKLVFSEKRMTSDTANDYQVFEVYQIKDATAGEMYEIQDAVELIMEEYGDYDSRRIQKRIATTMRGYGKEPLFGRYVRNSLGFIDGGANAEKNRSNNRISETGATAAPGGEFSPGNQQGVGQGHGSGVEVRHITDKDTHYSINPEDVVAAAKAYENGEIDSAELAKRLRKKPAENPLEIAANAKKAPTRAELLGMLPNLKRPRPDKPGVTMPKTTLTARIRCRRGGFLQYAAAI